MDKEICEMALSVLSQFERGNNTPHILIGISCAKEALEKQIPKKPNREFVSEENDIILHYCPNCSVRFFKTGMKYCGECGQALDWSEEAENEPE